MKRKIGKKQKERIREYYILKIISVNYQISFYTNITLPQKNQAKTNLKSRDF